MCKCSWGTLVLSIIILVLALVETANSKWIIVAAAALIIVGSLSCKDCGVMCRSCETKPTKKKSSKSKK